MASPTRLIVAALLVLAPGAAVAAEETPGTRLVLGETASREVEQDTLVAHLSARAEAPAAEDAQSTVNAAMSEAVAQAREVEAVQVATGGYRVYQQLDDEGRPRGWIAEQDLRLRSQETAVLLELVGDLQDRGLLLSGLGFELSEAARRALEDELTDEALERLQRRAARIAETLAMRVEGIEMLRVGGADDGSPVRPLRAARMDTEAAMAPPVAVPDRASVAVNVDAEITLLPR